MSRPIEEWADLKYLDNTLIAHVFEWGQGYSECGMTSHVGDWLGTGEWEEIETAKALPLCPTCKRRTEPDPRRDPAVETWREATRHNPIQSEDFFQ
jgi:hypothetical protein